MLFLQRLSPDILKGGLVLHPTFYCGFTVTVCATEIEVSQRWAPHQRPCKTHLPSGAILECERGRRAR
jgi:hypothetical protein